MITLYNLLKVLLLLKTCIHLQTIALLMLNFSALGKNLTSQTVLKAWMKDTHACHLELLLLPVTVSLLAGFTGFQSFAILI